MKKKKKKNNNNNNKGGQRGKGEKKAGGGKKGGEERRGRDRQMGAKATERGGVAERLGRETQGGGMRGEEAAARDEGTRYAPRVGRAVPERMVRMGDRAAGQERPREMCASKGASVVPTKRKETETEEREGGRRGRG